MGAVHNVQQTPLRKLKKMRKRYVWNMYAKLWVLYLVGVRAMAQLAKLYAET